MDKTERKPRGGRRFRAGAPSANPKGRPKIDKDLKEIIKAACPQAVETLVEICTSKSASSNARVAAASILLDRGYGKAVQPIDQTITIIDRMSTNDQRELLSAIQSIQAIQGDLSGDSGGATEAYH